MKLAELQKKVAEVLGVSSSQKELAFEIFVDNIYETLTDGITIKIPRIGFFQKKNVSHEDEIPQLLFSPLSGELKYESYNLFLTIEVLPKTKETVEIDSHIFSIGVGKPILPLNLDDMPDTETSYVMLKKSIEERVKELITESDLIPGFKIWDEYYNSPKKYPEEKAEDIQIQLAELTSDLVFQEPEELKNIPENLFEDDRIEPSSINNDTVPLKDTEDKFSDLHDLMEKEKNNLFDLYETKLNMSDITDQTIDEEMLDYSPKENSELPLGSLTIADLMDDTHSQKETENFGQEKINLPEEKVVTENAETEIKEEIISPVISSAEETIDEGVKEVIEETNIVEKKPEEIEEKSELIEEDDEKSEELVFNKEHRIEWNWGDDLKEEFGISNEEDADYEMMEDISERDNIKLIDEKIETGMRFTRDLFKQLEKTIEREIAAEDQRQEENYYRDEKKVTLDKTFQFRKSTDDQSDRAKKVVLEFSGPPVKYEFIEDKRFEKEKRMAITLVDEERSQFYDPYERPKYKPVKEESDKYFNKTFMIIFSAFVVVISVVIFFIMKANNPNQPSKSTDSSDSAILNESSSLSYKSEAQLKEERSSNNSQNLQKGTNIPLGDDYTGFPVGDSPPVPIKNQTSNLGSSTEKQINTQTGNDLFKSSASDTRVSGSIYFDGKTYNYQTSSWRNRDKAEQEAQRLRALGFTAFIMEVYLPQKGGKWYRVRVGSFNSAKEAQDFINKNKL